MTTSRSSQAIKIATRVTLLALVFYPLGVAWHEVVGHGLVGMLAGGRISYVVILTVQFWPEIRWVGWTGQYGACGVDDIPTTTGSAFMSLGGAMSTWCVGVIATILLRTRQWGPRLRIVLLVLSLWWIDLLTYTLPSWGLPRSVFWGQAEYSEPYEAAVELGVPGPLFQGFVVMSSAMLLSSFFLLLWRPPMSRLRCSSSL